MDRPPGQVRGGSHRRTKEILGEGGPEAGSPRRAPAPPPSGRGRGESGTGRFRRPPRPLPLGGGAGPVGDIFLAPSVAAGRVWAAGPPVPPSAERSVSPHFSPKREGGSGWGGLVTPALLGRCVRRPEEQSEPLSQRPMGLPPALMLNSIKRIKGIKAFLFFFFLARGGCSDQVLSLCVGSWVGRNIPLLFVALKSWTSRNRNRMAWPSWFIRRAELIGSSRLEACWSNLVDYLLIKDNAAWR